MSPVLAMRASVEGPQGGHPLKPLQHRPEMSPYVGKSDMVHITSARKVKLLSPVGRKKSTTGTLPHSSRSSRNRGLKKTLMFFDVGDIFLEMRMHKEMKNFFVTNQGSKL